MRQLTLSQSRLLSELTLPIQIHLGETELSASQLIDLRGGEYLNLEIDKESPITLLVAGEPIAQGKIVKKNDELGILITELFSTLEETTTQHQTIVEKKDNLENLI